MGKSLSDKVEEKIIQMRYQFHEKLRKEKLNAA